MEVALERRLMVLERVAQRHPGFDARASMRDCERKACDNLFRLRSYEGPNVSHEYLERSVDFFLWEGHCPEVPFPYERPTDRGCEPYSVIYQHHHARESEREQTYAAWPSVQQTAPPVPVNNSEEERGVAPQDDETAQAGEPSAPGSRLYFLSGPVGVDPDQWSDRGVDLDQHERSVITPFDHVELGDWAEKWLYDQVYLHPSEHMWAEIQGTPVQFPHAGAWRVELSNDARNWSLLVNQEMVDRCNGHYIGDYHGIVMLKVERPPGTVHIQLLTAFHRCAQRNPYASRELKILWRDVKRWWNMCQDLDYNFTIEEYFNALTAS